MKSKITENEVKKKISGWLTIRPEVIWWERLNAGMVRYHDRFIRLASAGTADLIALVRADIVHVLFIECKRPGGKQSPQQKYFEADVSGFPNVHYLLADNIGPVWDKINEIVGEKCIH